MALGVSVLGAMGVMAGIAWWQAIEARHQSVAATRAAVVRTAATLIDADPTRAALVLSELHGTPEPPGASEVAGRIARLPVSTIYRGHGGAVVSVAFNPANATFATSSLDGTARAWTARNERPPVELKGHTGSVSGVRWNPAGDRLLTWGTDDTARILATRRSDRSHRSERTHPFRDRGRIQPRRSTGRNGRL